MCDATDGAPPSATPHSYDYKRPRWALACPSTTLRLPCQAYPANYRWISYPFCNMGAKEKVIDVLREPALGRISFTLGGVRVLGRDFSRLITEINKSTLQVGVDPRIPSPAEYEPVRHIIRLKSNAMGTDVGSKAAIAHECTHAYLSNQNVPRVTNEVAAFLVEVLFNLAKDAFGTRNYIRPNPHLPLATTGEKGIAQQTLELIDKFQMNKRSCLLQPADFQALSKAILSHPSYGHLKIR
jgi:hypothetical protein